MSTNICVKKFDDIKAYVAATRLKWSISLTILEQRRFILHDFLPKYDAIKEDVGIETVITTDAA